MVPTRKREDETNDAQIEIENKQEEKEKKKKSASRRQEDRRQRMWRFKRIEAYTLYALFIVVALPGCCFVFCRYWIL